MKIGYARVSTRDQKLDLQLNSLKKAGCRKIFREKVSGFNRQRPEFQRMLDQIRPGDIIVVWKLDRLARSTRDLLNTMDRRWMPCIARDSINAQPTVRLLVR